MRHHCLKTWPKFFDAVARGEKRFELRKNDRDFKVGDILTLQRWDPKISDFTGAELDFRVTYVFKDATMGVQHGYCILSLGGIEL